MAHLPRSTEVFVIGGGPAGLASAIAARLRGFDAVVVDCAVPPIDKACGEGIMPDGVAAAAALGIRLERAGAQPFPGIRFCDSGHSAEARFPNGQGFGVRRTALHRLMVDCALNAGVQLLWGVHVRGIEDGRVCLDDCAVRAQWIIGADGANSRVRHWACLDASIYHRRRFGFRRHYRVQPWTEFMEIHWADACQLYITPVADDELCVTLISHSPALRPSEALLLFPEVNCRLADARTEKPIERGGITAHRRLQHVTGNRVALVGDASGSVDAITGEGLCLLFQQAAALAAALEAEDLRLYEAEHRRIGRRPEWMADLLLLLDRQRWIRRCAMHTFASYPRIFSRFLALHVGHSLGLP
jgi:flavin-dependent dehydrogenase